MQHQQFRPQARSNCVSTTLIVAEFDEYSIPVERLDHSTDLPARESFGRALHEQGHNIENRW
jgi:hypothetical protein